MARHDPHRRRDAAAVEPQLDHRHVVAAMLAAVSIAAVIDAQLLAPSAGS